MRFEKFSVWCKYSRAKVVGTILCLGGAIIMSFLMSPPTTPNLTMSVNKTWMLGCFYFLCAVILLSFNTVLQITELKNAIKRDWMCPTYQITQPKPLANRCEEKENKKFHHDIDHPSAMFIKGDVTNTGDVSAAFEKHVEIYGGLDICVNSAGVGTTVKCFDEDESDGINTWRRIISINFVVVIDCTRISVPKLADFK